MVFFKGFAAIAAMTFIVGCGEEQAKENKAANETVVETSTSEVAVPKMLIAKVPVDANGNELNDEAEMRALNTNLSGSESEVALSFNNGQQVSIENELDQDSSTQQYHNQSQQGQYGNQQQGQYGNQQQGQYGNQHQQYPRNGQVNHGRSHQHHNSSSYYWSTPWYPGKLLGRGTIWGRNPYRYSSGVQYVYNYRSNFTYGGCRYYTYYAY